MKLARTKKCAVCRSTFQPANSLQRVCGLVCSVEHGRTELRRQARKAKTEGRRKLMTRRDWIKKAQVAVNRYVRARDYGRPCISCGSMPEQRFGGTMDAGHFRSTGSAPNLRFYTLQIAAQCVKCNRHRGGMAVEFRKGLIARYGVVHVERVEAMQAPGKWSIEYLQRLTKLMNRKAAKLERRHAV